MALDLALLHEVIRAPEAAPPCLRVYSWMPPCVSLGFHQRVDADDVRRYRRLGYGVVRRPTGGRAVLHLAEITYSVVVAESVFRRPTSVIESYACLSLGLIEALALLGIRAELAPGISGDKVTGSKACFASAARCDLAHGGRKIVGSAQVRKKGAILQHGSIPLVDRREAEADALLGEGAQPIAGVVSVAEAAGRTVSYSEAAGAIRAGFERAFSLSLTDMPLNEELLGGCEAFRPLVRVGAPQGS